MTIPARLSIVTLGVADLPRSVAFYAALGWDRSPASMDEIVWFRLTGSALGLFSRADLAADAGVPVSGSGFSGVTLAINVETEDLVDSSIADALAAGGSIAKPPTHAEWGGYSGYFADPDGHLWEVAYNPTFPLVDGVAQI